jgi:hypothetical protein
VSLFLTVHGTKRCNHSLAPWSVFFDWDQHSNCEQPSDSKVASEQCTDFLHLALAVKQSSTVKAAGMWVVQIGVYSIKARFKSKLKWRWVQCLWLRDNDVGCAG